MSVQALTCALAIRGVSASEKLLLLALANYADEKMRCWPSQARLADDTCLSERTVRTLLAALEAKAMVSRQVRRREDGSRSSDVITLHFAGVVVTGADHQPEIISGGGEIIAGGVGKPLPGGGEMASGLTTFEPSLNQSKEPSTPASRRQADPSPEDIARGAAPAIWAETPKLGRERSSQNDLARALAAAVRRGKDLTRVRFALRAAYASSSYSGEHAKGVHRLIQNDRWESFVAEAGSATKDWTPERWRIAVELFHERGLWKHDLGPRPDEPGCWAPSSALSQQTGEIVPFQRSSAGVA